MGEEDVNVETETAAGDMGEVAGEAEKNAGANQQVPRSSAGNSATQFSAPGDSFSLVIKDVIRSLEDDPTQKELRVEASQAEERPPAVAQENVSSAVAQQDVSKQPATYVRRAKKQKVCVCSNYNFDNSFSFSVIH
jgi:hypothetical protein